MAFAKSVAALGAALGTLIVGNGASAQPADAAVPAEWLDSQLNERGQKCDKRGERVDASSLLLACGAAGAWEVTLSEAGPRFVKSYEFPGEVVGFFNDPEGQLWVKLQVLEARLLSSAGLPGAVSFPNEQAKPAPVPPAPAPVASRKPARVAEEEEDEEEDPEDATGEVLKSSPGEVIISLGEVNGVGPGDRIELSFEPDDDAGPASLSRETLAVGVVTHVSPHTAKVRLGMNERVSTGALATVTRAQATASLIAPPRVSGGWGAEVMLRPFAAIGELGGGALFSAAMTRRFPGKLVLRALLDPLALADVQGRDSVTAVNAVVTASYDSTYFEMGLGLGAQTVNQTDFFVQPGSGVSVAQLVRFGAQDGLSLSARTSIVLFHSEFEFGGMVANFQVPVSRGYWLLFGGGGGNVGYGYGEFGVRALLSGDGHAGSKFLTVTAGGASVFHGSNCGQLLTEANTDFILCEEERNYAGPMAGIGGEWRF
jgi:hypothetical protein